jgi:signal transduction histidine kinase
MGPDPLAIAQRRLVRERAARHEAEEIAERVTSELYGTSLALRHTNDELTALNDALREFVAVASHDLRGPLTGILGMASLLRLRWDEIDPVRRLECFESIERQGHLAARLVDDLLTVSRIEAGALDANAEVLELRDVVGGVLHDLPAGGAVRVVGGSLRVSADLDHLRRILGNYVANALKYGDAPVWVEIREAGPWAEILVRDEGEGVPEDLVPRLFGKFARGGGSRAQSGTGLGLSIVRGLARANGGDTWYEPNAPRGSCFGVRLPKAAA